MKAYSGSTSEGFLPAAMPVTGTAATAVAPAPQDPSATFADALEQQQGTPPGPAFAGWAASFADEASGSAAGATLPATADSTATPAAFAVQSDLALPHYVWIGKPAAASAAPSSETTPDRTPDPESTTDLPFSATTMFHPLLPASPGDPNPKTPTAAALDDDTTTSSDGPATANKLSLPFASWLGQPALPASAPSGKTATLTDDSSDSSPDRPSENGVTDTFSLTPYAWTSQRPSLSTSTAATAAGPAAFPPLAPRVQATPSARTSISSSLPAGAQGADLDFTGATIVASVIGRGALHPAIVPKSDALPSQSPSSASILSGSPLATIMAHATILAANTKASAPARSATATIQAVATPADATKNSVTIASASSILTGSTKPSPAASPLEKKSSASSSERSFLQEDVSHAAAADLTSNLLQTAVASLSDAVVNQSVATNLTSTITSSTSVASAPISAAGMANGKKMDDMNSTLEMPSLVMSNGTNPLVTRTSADLHIALGSNHDFNDALNQVMHVAELSNMSRSTPPLRVAIEIQTPPGAIVNVYVSRQADSSYRAQLSTNDPQALSWVQDQISSLKNTTSDTGSAIRWSPAQLEPGTGGLSSSSGSAGNERGYDWNRGGQQGQSGQQQDARNPRRPLESDEEETDFAATFATAGGAL